MKKTIVVDKETWKALSLIQQIHDLKTKEDAIKFLLKRGVRIDTILADDRLENMVENIRKKIF